MSDLADLTDLAALGLNAGALANFSTEVKQAHLTAASDEVKGYLRKRYKLPLVSWGSEVKRWVCDIAAFTLMTSQGYSPEGRDNPFSVRAAAARRTLLLVSQGLYIPDVVETDAEDDPKADEGFFYAGDSVRSV